MSRELVNLKPAAGGVWHLYCVRDAEVFSLLPRGTKQATHPSWGANEVHNVTLGIFRAGRQVAGAVRGSLAACKSVTMALFNLFNCVVVKFSEVNRGVLPRFVLYSGDSKRARPLGRELVNRHVHGFRDEVHFSAKNEKGR